jgi:hypothetical protein
MVGQSLFNPHPRLDCDRLRKYVSMASAIICGENPFDRMLNTQPGCNGHGRLCTKHMAEAAEGIAQSTRPPVTPLRLQDHYGSANRLRLRDHLLAAWEITTKIHDDHKSKKSNDAADTMNAQDKLGVDTTTQPEYDFTHDRIHGQHDCWGKPQLKLQKSDRGDYIIQQKRFNFAIGFLGCEFISTRFRHCCVNCLQSGWVYTLVYIAKYASTGTSQN